MRIGITYSILREEERLLKRAAEDFGEVRMLHESELSFPARIDVDVAIIRNVSHFKALYTSKLLEEGGIKTVNPSWLIGDAGDKAMGTAKLSKKVPVPKWGVAVDEKQALRLAERIGYPLVVKPVFGSWGRLISKVNDRDALEALLEHRKYMGNPLYRIYYLQEFVEKPGRDIRAVVIGGEFVTAMYRYSDHWITNAARGGKGVKCENEAVKELSVKAWEAFGEGALAIDIFESERGLLVNEVNPTMEFKAAFRSTGVDVARKLVEYAVEVARN